MKLLIYSVMFNKSYISINFDFFLIQICVCVKQIKHNKS